MVLCLLFCQIWAELRANSFLQNFRYRSYFEKLKVPDGLFSIVMVCFSVKSISYAKPSLTH